MDELSPAAWGHSGRHYAQRPGEASRQSDPDSVRAALNWETALFHADPDVRDAVARTVKQWNTILRDYLRTETALRLSVGDESQSVPVKVVDGMPRPFADVMRQYEGLEWLILNRPAVVAAFDGTWFMEQNFDRAPREWIELFGARHRDEINRAHETAGTWLRKLDEMNALEKITGINEDVLGAYFFHLPEIRIYWVVIGITARALGVSADALTVVVLAHELAHAYTHLGRDIDNEKWDTWQFAGCDLDIVEGLAQFYTAVLCQRLDQRMPAALAAYKTLLDRQSGPYRAHLKWVPDKEHGGEIVRTAMIDCRSNGIIEASKFTEAIEKYRLFVRGKMPAAKT